MYISLLIIVFLILALQAASQHRKSRYAELETPWLEVSLLGRHIGYRQAYWIAIEVWHRRGNIPQKIQSLRGVRFGHSLWLSCFRREHGSPVQHGLCVLNCASNLTLSPGTSRSWFLNSHENCRNWRCNVVDHSGRTWLLICPFFFRIT